MAKAEYRSAIRSRNLINMALADLLQKKPLEKITVTEVVKVAQVNRGTFYAHYADIPDVIRHITNDTFAHIRKKVFESSQKLEDLPHILMMIVRELVETNMDFCRKVMNSSASFVMEEQLMKLISDYLVQNESRYCKGDREQYVLTVQFCAGGLSKLYRDWFAEKIPVSLEKLTKQGEALLNKLIITNSGLSGKKPAAAL